MNNETHENSQYGTNDLFHAVRKSGVSMRPRWYFVVKSVLAVIGASVLLVGLLFAASLVVFSLRKSGALAMLSFGPSGWYELFFVLPWMVILVSVVAVLLLEEFLRRYSVAYRLPIIYTFTALLFVAACGAVVIDRMELHSHLRDISDQEGRLPMKGFYDTVTDDHAYCLIEGGIVEQGSGEAVVREGDGELMRVVFDTRTHFPEGREFATSDRVLIFGENDGMFVRAMGIRLLPQ